MKIKILFSSLVLLLACNIYADNIHKEISELFYAVFKRQFPSRLVKNIVAPHFDKTLQKNLPDDLNKTANLTGKLFLFVLSEYLEVNENKRNIDFTVYPLPKGYKHGMMRSSNSKLISVKGRSFDTGLIERNYLVKVQMGLGVPSEKIIFLSMWKRNNKFFITPAGCILGNKSFSDAAGRHYKIKPSSFYWDTKKLERFINFLRKTKQFRPKFNNTKYINPTVFKQIKNYILVHGDKRTYCNMYNNNPHTNLANVDIFLDPDTGPQNINCDLKLSDFNHMVIRTQSLKYFRISLDQNSIVIQNSTNIKELGKILQEVMSKLQEKHNKK